MAEAYRTLACISSGLTDQEYPDRNIRPTPIYGTDHSSYNIAWTNERNNQKRLFFKFEAVPTEIKYKRLYYVTMSCYVSLWSNNGYRGTIALYAPYRDFNPETVTYNTRPGGIRIGNVENMSGSSGITAVLPNYTNEYEDHVYKTESAKKLLKYNGAYIYSPYENTGRIDVADLDYRINPWYLVCYDDAIDVTSTVVGTGKTSGYLNPHTSQEMAWNFVPDGDYYCAADWVQHSAVFHWRSGTSGAWNDVTASGANQSVTIPANTFPVGTIQWYVSGTDDVGTSTDSPIYTITTADSAMIATPISPINMVEDGSAAIIFTWSASNNNGNAPTGADLQYSSDGSTWTAMASVTGAASTYSAPANSLPGGVLYWRVRAYNADGVAGAWSDAVNFISVSAPAAPLVSVNAVPFAVISWQSVGQQAYKVTVDGVSYGPYFGKQKSYTLPDYLTDGEHTARVEVEGSYGLWSAAGEVTFTVANVPGDAIRLSGVFYRDAQLSWETESQTADFLIYRDGTRIGHTSGSSFTDRVILGRHSWQVINRLPGGFYTASNVVEGELKSCGLAVAPLAGGEWLELTKSASSTREIGTTISQAASVRHFAGEIWPSAEVAPYRDQAVAFDVAWLQREKTQAAAFEALIGQTVILKAPDGSCVVGLLSAVSRRSQVFFQAYTATVTRVKWRDYIDADR